MRVKVTTKEGWQIVADNLDDAQSKYNLLKLLLAKSVDGPAANPVNVAAYPDFQSGVVIE